LHRLRNRLLAAFLAATILPLAATLWITASLLERSLGYTTTAELDHLSQSLESTVREFYQRERDTLRDDAGAGRVSPTSFSIDDTNTWPDSLREFWSSGESERFGLSGAGGNHIEYLLREENGVAVYTRQLGGIRMQALTEELRESRALVDSIEGRDLERGFTLTLVLLVTAVWLVALASLIYVASRITRPIQELAAGLADFAAGNMDRRLDSGRSDEVGQAIDAFNDMAGQLARSRERLVYLTRVASWQTLARKTAHELKNSLTPIRLTVEEMVARTPKADDAFMAQAGQIVVSEIDTLERRVRAFSEFSSEPSARPETIDLNACLEERVSLLRPNFADVHFDLRLDGAAPTAWAGPDQVRGILTNLLKNAAEAAGRGGRVLGLTASKGKDAIVEIHDSGSGLSQNVVEGLFEPMITFKKDGMGLGLSIARKNAMLSGGDIDVIEGRLGGAGFRVVLPRNQAQR